MDDLTLFEVEELVTYWMEHPPVHLSVAAFLGTKGERTGQPSHENADLGITPDLDQLKAMGTMFGAGIVKQ